MERSKVNEIINGTAPIAGVAEQFIKDISDNVFRPRSDSVFKCVNEAAYRGGKVEFERQITEIGEDAAVISYRLTFPRRFVYSRSSKEFPELPDTEYTKAAKNQIIGLIKDIAEDEIPEAVANYSADCDGLGYMISSRLEYEYTPYNPPSYEDPGGWDGYAYPVIEIDIIARALAEENRKRYPFYWKCHKRKEKPLKAEAYLV